jgi:hypothetical protein
MWRSLAARILRLGIVCQDKVSHHESFWLGVDIGGCVRRRDKLFRHVHAADSFTSALVADVTGM